jgi:uroporphyrin-III C-methyltransferase
MRGKVIFVGAGAGSADLLTRRAVRCLERADVVLHDDLVSRDVMDFVSPSAIVRNVGKRCGRAGISQEAVNGLMVEYARRGKSVVRLKSGDAGMFGRLGEEMEALQEAGITFEIVPGVTSGLAAAAAANISLTDRRIASRVVFAAASLADGKRQDWRKIALSNTTLVIYMPGRDLTSLAEELQTAGIAGDVACAVISRAGAADESIASGTVSRMGDMDTGDGPSVVIVGEVAAVAKGSKPDRLRVAAETTAEGAYCQTHAGSRRSFA